MNRFKKKVIQFGSSRVIRMTEADIGEEFIVMSIEEFNFLKKDVSEVPQIVHVVPPVTPIKPRFIEKPFYRTTN